MNTRLAFLTLAIAAAPLTASAQAVNVDNDWASFFRYNPASVNVAKPAQRATPRPGDVSPDGQYVFVNDQRGWQLRPYSYVWSGGQLAHASDCPYVYASTAPASKKAGRAG